MDKNITAKQIIRKQSTLKHIVVSLGVMIGTVTMLAGSLRYILEENGLM